MELQYVLAFIGAIAIGVSLGLIGGGGSILTVPVLTYILGVDAVLSTAYSLFIVGLTALVGAIRYWRKELIDMRTGILFAIPSLLAVWLTRTFLIPAIPDVLFEWSGMQVSKDMGIMVFFALVMMAASFSMIRRRKNKEEETPVAPKERKMGLIFLEGSVVGVVTGIVGAGGGFLIVPALVLLAGLPMKKAVGTSLMIIAAKSLIGFTGDMINPNLQIDWSLLLTFSSLTIIGIVLGTWLGNFIEGQKLKRAFGWFLLIMGVIIITERVGQLKRTGGGQQSAISMVEHAETPTFSVESDASHLRI